jgi:hypothetical protein
VGSRDINASVACSNIGAFVTAAAFIPSESNATVASAMQNIAPYRRFGGHGTWKDLNNSKRCYAVNGGIASSTNRKIRMLRFPATKTTQRTQQFTGPLGSSFCKADFTKPAVPFVRLKSSGSARARRSHGRRD